MEAYQHLKHPAARMLEHYIPLLVDTVSSARPPLPDWWMAQTEQLLLTLFLCGHRHNYSHLLQEDWQRPSTLENLAEATGASIFSLFR